jgi:azurin
MKKITYLALFISGFFLVSCGGNENKEATEEQATETVAEPTPMEHPTEFTIKAQGNTMPDMKFDTDKITVNAGKEITFTLVNEGDNETMMHNIVVIYNGYAEEVASRGLSQKENSYVEAGDAAVVAASPLSGPGETVTLKFTIEKPGTYQYVCTYPGHWSKMLGTLIVE